MTTMMKEVLTNALNKKNNDIKEFVWKGRKVEVDGVFVQEEKRLIDSTEGELKGYLAHCDSMLFNNNKEYPGRYILLGIIKDQIEKCNTELFLRWLEGEKGITRFSFLKTLNEFLNANKEAMQEEQLTPKDLQICMAVGECPQEFADISISNVLNGCVDKLGQFDKTHLTFTFILKQGLWFTREESSDLTEKDAQGKIRDKVAVAKDRLHLKQSTNIRITPKGLSYAEFRAMTSLRSKKYSDLTSIQLTTLRNKVLFNLSEEVNFHISQWENRKREIMLVCEHKQINLG